MTCNLVFQIFPDNQEFALDNFPLFVLKLEKGKREVCIDNAEDMGTQYDFLSESIRQTIDEVVSPRQRKNYNGRKMSQRTLHLHQQRIRDFNSGRQITKVDRTAWYKVLKEAGLDDYKDWVKSWVEQIKAADNLGNIKEISKGVKVLSGKTRSTKRTQPSMTRQGTTITCADELGDLWQQFLEKKFSATELENTRDELTDLEEYDSVEKDALTEKEFLIAVKRMKKAKATGPDCIPAEVWKYSQLAKDELYFYLRALCALEM